MTRRLVPAALRAFRHVYGPNGFLWVSSWYSPNTWTSIRIDVWKCSIEFSKGKR